MSSLSLSSLNLLLLALWFHLILVVHSITTTSPDFHPLMSFKASSDPTNTTVLSQWNSTSSNPCIWHGISCLPNNRVSHLVLEYLNLSGSILPLTSLTQLRLLSLKHNCFHDPIPSSLRLLFLSHNNFFGPFPTASLPISTASISPTTTSPATFYLTSTISPTFSP